MLHAFDVSEIDAPPAQVEAALDLVPTDDGRLRRLARSRPPRAPVQAERPRRREHGDDRRRRPGAQDRRGGARGRRAGARSWGCSIRPSSATTDSIRYVRELGAATAPVDRGDASAAFLLRAPTVDQVRAVADAGAVMPQKSTYFFPKLHCGFLINPLDA